MPGRAIIATAIAHPESGLNPDAHNSTPPDDSYGLWQINMLGTLGPARRVRYGLKSNADLFDPKINAKVMAGESAGGFNFIPWTGYTSGAYRQFIPQAQAAATRVDSLSPSEIEKVLGGIAAGIGAAAGAVTSPLQKAKDLASTLYSIYTWLLGSPAPDAEAVAAVRHGLLRIAEVIGGMILVVIGINIFTHPVIGSAAKAARTAAKVGAVAAA